MSPAEVSVLHLAGDVASGRAELSWAEGRARRLHPAAVRFLHDILTVLYDYDVNEERNQP